MEDLIDIEASPVSSFLDRLLRDMTTKRNIIWATDTYADCGPGFLDTDEMKSAALLRHAGCIRPRIEKTQEDQAARTRKKAEVFTPAWLCNEMNNHLDREWFGREGVFNTGNADHTWSVSEEPVAFPPQSGRKMPLWQRCGTAFRFEDRTVQARNPITGEAAAVSRRVLSDFDVGPDPEDFVRTLSGVIQAHVRPARRGGGLVGR